MGRHGEVNNDPTVARQLALSRLLAPRHSGRSAVAGVSEGPMHWEKAARVLALALPPPIKSDSTSAFSTPAFYTKVEAHDSPSGSTRSIT